MAFEKSVVFLCQLPCKIEKKFSTSAFLKRAAIGKVHEGLGLTGFTKV